MLEEQEIGVTQLLSTGTQIKGAYKYRYSDFIVNEIDLDQNIVFINRNQQQIDDQHIQHQKLKQQEYQQMTVAQYLQIFKAAEFVEEEVIKKFYSFVNDKRFGDNTCDKFYFEMESDDKFRRTQIHQIVNEYFVDFESSTENVDQKQIIAVKYLKNSPKRKKLNDEQYHLEFTLMKTNLDQYTALSLIANHLKRSYNDFSINGNKDKRGITTQKVSIFKCAIEQIQKINKIEKLKNQIQVSDFKYLKKEQKLGLGNLMGNRFSILLRFIEESDQVLMDNIEKLKQSGFINYYGLQRFGSMDIKTHQIGKSIMQRQFETAFRMIVGVKDRQESINQAKQQYLENYDSSLVLNKLTYKNKLEKNLIQSLKKNKNNFKDTIMQMPRNQRELYPHAYQSYIWNTLVSRRLQKYGGVMVKGDLVVDKDNNPDYQQIKNDSTFGFRTVVKLVTEDDLQSLKYTVQDIVVPVIGTEVSVESFANTIYADLMTEILSSENIDMHDFEKAAKEFFLTGNYRQMIATPLDFEYEILHFKEKNDDVITPFYNEEKNISFDKDDCKFKGLNIRFSLLKSQYATMLIRELTKRTTSLAEQQNINNEMETK